MTTEAAQAIALAPSDQPAQRAKVPMAWAAAALAEMCDRLEDGEEPTAAFTFVFNETRLDLAEAVDRRIAFIKLVEGSITAAEQARDEWALQKTRLESLLAAMKERTKEIVETFPDLPYKGTLGRFAVQKNGGAQALDLSFGGKEITPELIDMFQIPERFVKTKVSYALDVDGIRAAIAKGEELPWAKLAPRGTHLRVRQ